MASLKHYHSYFVLFIAVIGAIFGLITGFSFSNPSSVKIYLNSVIAGLSATIVCIYSLIILTYMVLISFDNGIFNFAFNEIIT